MDWEDALRDMLPAAWFYPEAPPLVWLAQVVERLAAQGIICTPLPTRPPHIDVGQHATLWLGDGTEARLWLYPCPDRVEVSVWAIPWHLRSAVDFHTYLTLLQHITGYLLDQVCDPAVPVRLEIQTWEEAQCFRPDDDDMT